MHAQSALSLHHQFLNKKLSAQEITQTFLKRIEKYNSQIGAFLTVYSKEAMEQAKALDAKLAAGHPVGKLAAVPIAIKDNIHVKGELTTCGSHFLTNYRPPFSATVVNLLQEADAIILGKTNLDEFAMGSSTEHSALLETKNPWNLNCVPGGSSGGSTAAVAARLCPLALGTDTGGSIRQPAAFCGLVGFKPTYGRVSRYGLVAFGSSLDQIGPIASNTADAAFVMEVIGKQCHKDSTSLSLPQQDYVKSLSTEVAGIRIGVPWKLIEQCDKDTQTAFQRSLNCLKEAGAKLIDLELKILDSSIAVYYILATAEASTNLARFDGIRYGVRAPQAKTLEEVYRLSKQQGFGPEVKRRILLGTYVLSAGYHDAFYIKAQKVRTLIIEQFKRAFHLCDTIATPVTPSAAFERGAIHSPLEMYLQDMFTIPSNLAGLPSISVPNGFSQNHLPLGLQFITPAKEDRQALSIAHAYESLDPIKERIPKQFQSEVE